VAGGGDCSNRFARRKSASARIRAALTPWRTVTIGLVSDPATLTLAGVRSHHEHRTDFSREHTRSDRVEPMKALVTGGAGFIGSHLVDALVARGDRVVVIDDLSTGNGANITSALEKGATLIPADVTDLAAVKRAVADFRPDCVFHLAAQVDVRVSVGDPGLDVRINVEGTVNLLETARSVGTRNFVLASSCAVYGEPDDGSLPLVEKAPLRPGSPYGQAKLAAEGYTALYRDLHGMRTANLRFGNVYGPRQGSVGEAGVVAIFCRALIGGGIPQVFGSGEQTRDFVYVGDVVRALLAAADGDVSGEFNVGTGIETSVLDLIEELAIVGGRRDFIPEQLPPRPGEVERMILDSTLARERLRWEPRTGLREGLTETWRENVRRRHGPHRQIYEVPGAGPQAASG
jgi:UDP-glucose 4-epimerase